MNKNEEALVILAEECAEVQQLVSKALRFGLEYNHLNETVQERLNNEVADMLCMVEILKERRILDEDALRIGIQAKREKLKLWSKLFVEETNNA